MLRFDYYLSEERIIPLPEKSYSFHLPLHPFSTTNSSELLGIIQNWVSSGPTLVLEGLSVRVNQHCPTRIESLEDGECENEAMYDPHMVELDSSAQCVHSKGNWAPIMHALVVE